MSFLFEVITVLVLAFSVGVLLYKGVGNRLKIGGFLRRIYPPFSVACVTLVCLGATLPLWEMGLRHYFNHYGSEQDRVRYVYSAGKIKTQQSRMIGLPYIGFGLSPAYPDFNTLGYRGAEIQQPKPAGTFRIVALGGSTTFGFGLLAEEAYPAQLERILRLEHGYEQVEVINAGVELYTSWEILNNFQFRVLDLEPDLIIYYEATNEITARLVAPDAYNGLNERRGIWQTNQSDLPSSTVWRWIALHAGWMEDPAALESSFVFESDIQQCDMWTERVCAGYPIPDLMRLNPPIYFERNLRSLIAVAQAHQVQVLLSSWAYFPDTTTITNIYTFPWRRAAVADHNQITAQVAQDTQVAFYDLASTLDYNLSYWLADGYHQSAEGAEQQARLYANFLMEQGLVAN